MYAAAAAAAKSLQSCPTLCDPIDGSPSGSTYMYRLKEKFILLSPLMSSQISQYSEIELEVNNEGFMNT